MCKEAKFNKEINKKRNNNGFKTAEPESIKNSIPNDTKNDYFCAMRWQDNVTEDYNPVRGKPGHQHWWREQKIKVTNPATGNSTIVRPVDWGPNVTTGRAIDLSHRAMEEINATTDVTWVEMCIVDSDTPLGLVTNQQDNKK